MSDLSPIGLRQRKKEKTHRHIAEVALGLFQEKGYDATTIEQIAEAAFISPRTFFRYYGAKEEVVFARHADYLRELRAALARRPPEEPPLRAVSEALVALASVLQDDRAFLVAQVRLICAYPTLLRQSREIARQWEDALYADLRARAAGSPSARLLIVAAAAVATMITAMRSWHEGGATEPLPALMRDAFGELHGAVRESKAATA